MQAWYLDASCVGGQWNAALVTKGKEVVAVWPYFLKKKGPWSYVAMPQLTRQMGPYIIPAYRNPRHETRLLDKLLAELPSGLAAFEQDFNYTITNWLPLYWQGFRQTTRYSYLLDIKDLKTVRDGLAPDYRNHKIPKAVDKVQVRTGGTLAEFQQVHDRGYARQGLPAPVSAGFLQHLDAVLAAHGQREMFFARDRSGHIHSVAYLVWDANAAYYLLAGDDPAYRASGAGILVAWEAIRYAHQVLKLSTFDFAGSMVRPIERVRRQFGAVQQPYFRVQREWSLFWKLGKLLR